MNKDMICKTFALGVIILFVTVGIQPVLAVENKLSGIIEKEKDCAITFHIYDKKEERQKEIVLSEDEAIQIYNVGEKLRHMIRNEPMSEKTKNLKIEFVNLLDIYDLIPKGLSKDYILSLLNPTWLNNKQKTIGVRPVFSILKGFITRILGVFTKIQQFFKMRFRNNLPIDINENIQQSESLQMTATAGYSFIQGAGSGGVFQWILFPRPRFFYRWSCTDGGFGVDEYTGKGFQAWAPLNVLLMGFIGFGISIPIPFESLVFVFFGYALYVSVNADYIEFYP